MSEFDFDSGALSLDFVNTKAWWGTEREEDELPDYDALARWGEAAGLLAPERVAELRDLAKKAPGAATTILATAVALRAALYRIFVAVAEGSDVAADDLAVLNKELQAALPHLAVAPAAESFAWLWRHEPLALDIMLWPVARDAAELLTSDDLDRVGRCADETGCNYLFLDTSRNRSRRWCSMETCGNRAKARRHYRRATGNM